MREYKLRSWERENRSKLRCTAAKQTRTTTMTMKTYDRLILSVFMVLATTPMLALAISAATH
jgi:hypothetical protein